MYLFVIFDPWPTTTTYAMNESDELLSSETESNQTLKLNSGHAEPAPKLEITLGTYMSQNVR